MSFYRNTEKAYRKIKRYDKQLKGLEPGSRKSLNLNKNVFMQECYIKECIRECYESNDLFREFIDSGKDNFLVSSFVKLKSRGSGMDYEEENSLYKDIIDLVGLWGDQSYKISEMGMKREMYVEAFKGHPVPHQVKYPLNEPEQSGEPHEEV